MKKTPPSWEFIARDSANILDSLLDDVEILGTLVSDHIDGGPEDYRYARHVLFLLLCRVEAHIKDRDRLDKRTRKRREADAAAEQAARPSPPSDTEMADVCRNLAREFDHRATMASEEEMK